MLFPTLDLSLLNPPHPVGPYSNAIALFIVLPIDNYNFYYSPLNKASQSSPSGCLPIQLPVNETSNKDELNLIAEFDLELHVSDDCSSCHFKEGKGIDIGITQKCFDARTHVNS